MAFLPAARPYFLAGLVLACCLSSPPAMSAADEVPEEINQLLRTRQYAAALQRLESLARADHIGALRQLAILYRVGRGVPRDRTKALDYLSRAAKLGDAESQFYLGKLLVDDATSDGELNDGLAWLKKAAAQGYQEAGKAYQEASHKTVAAKPAQDPSGPVPSPADLEQPGEYLTSAAEHGNLELLARAISGGARIDARDRHGRTALSAAVEAGRTEAVRFLLNKGAAANARLARGNTALLLATKAGRPALVKLLLAAGANPEARDDSGNNALIYAVSNKSAEMVRLLLAHGADVNATDSDGWSVLDVARAGGNEAVRSLLKKAGAKPRIAKTEDRSRTARMLAAQSDQKSRTGLLSGAIAQSNHDLLAHLLGEGPVDLAALDAEGYSPLARAVQAGDPFAVKLLLRRGAPVQALDAHGYTPVHYAIDGGSVDLLEALLGAGGIDPAGEWGGEYPLLYAIRSGREALAIVLLQHGFVPAVADGKGEDTFVAAARNNAVALLTALADRGRDLSRYRDKGGKSLFWHAVTADQYGTAVFLMKQGAARRLSKASLSDLLIVAARRGDLAMLKLLGEAGANVDAQSGEGTSALMTAAAIGCLDCIAYLVDHGAAINDRDRMGNTALHIAVLNGKAEAAERLIESGADRYIVNDAGESYASITAQAKAAAGD